MNIRIDHERVLIEELFYGLAASTDAFLIDREARKCRPATMIFYRRELGYFLNGRLLIRLNISRI